MTTAEPTHDCPSLKERLKYGIAVAKCKSAAIAALWRVAGKPAK
jgi:hypothetical protein